MNTASELTQQNDPKAKLLLLNETLEQRIVDRTAQLANMYQKWMNEIAERKHAEARYQEAQLEVLLASRLSAAGQMATALSHELNQPLTAAANSISAVRRILLGGDWRREVWRLKFSVTLPLKCCGSVRSSAGSEIL